MQSVYNMIYSLLRKLRTVGKAADAAFWRTRRPQYDTGGRYDYVTYAALVKQRDDILWTLSIWRDQYPDVYDQATTSLYLSLGYDDDKYANGRWIYSYPLLSPLRWRADAQYRPIPF